MAYDSSSDQYSQEELAQGQSGQPAGQQNVQLSGGGGGFAGQGGASSPGQQGGPQQPSTSGSWTNLNSYLSANADQAPALGQGIASAVGKQAQTAQDNLITVQQGFKSQAPYQDINNTTSSNIDQAFSDPSLYANQTSGGVTTQPNTATPEKYLNNNWGFNSQNQDISQYGGSSGQPSWGSTANDFQNASTALQNTQSESGRGTLLQDQYGKNGTGYNQGQQSFDQLLLQQNPDNQAALDSVYKQYAPTTTLQGTGISQAQQSALDSANKYATDAKNKAAGYQTQAIGDLNNQIGSLGKNVSGEVTADQTNWPAAYNDMLSAIRGHAVSTQQAKDLGITGNENIYNTDASQYLTANANPYTGSGAQNVAATHGDWQNFSGLQNLIGGMSNNGSASSALNSIGLTGDEATQAQAPKTNPYTFNVGNYSAGVNNAALGYQQAYNTPVIVLPGQTNPESYAQMADDIARWTGGTGNASDAGPAYAPWVTAEQNAISQFNSSHGLGNTLSVNAPKPVAASFPKLNNAIQ